MARMSQLARRAHARPTLLQQLAHDARRRLRTPVDREGRNIRRLMLMSALEGVISGGIITFLPVFLARMNASALLVSLVTALPALAAIVVALPAGAMATRWRNVVPVSALAFQLYRVSFLAVALATLLPAALAPFVAVALRGLGAIPQAVGNAVWHGVSGDAASARRRPL